MPLLVLGGARAARYDDIQAQLCLFVSERIPQKATNSQISAKNSIQKEKKYTMVLGEFLTVTELSKSLRVSRSCIYGLVRRGILPSGLKLGHSRRWCVADVQTALDSMKEATNND